MNAMWFIEFRFDCTTTSDANFSGPQIEVITIKSVEKN